MTEKQTADAGVATPSRRDFLRTGATTSAIAALAATGNYAFAAEQNRIRVGLIGCGGRGTQAAEQSCNSSANVELWAMGDLFKDRLDGSKNTLKTLGDKFKVTPERSFTGFDAYKNVLASGIDLVILATPPGFRPWHLRAAIEANKHVFTEKPVSVDAPGIRMNLETAEMAKRKNLAIVAGTQRRHQTSYLDIMKRIQDGAIGDVVAGQCFWNQGSIWMHTREPQQSDVEWQCRNWYYFTWLCGDHIVEQHIHNLDVMNWAMGGHPVKALGLGGRQVRTDPNFGHIFDHFAIEFEYPNGARVMSMCRQQDNTSTNVSEHIVGTKGTSNGTGYIRGANPYRFQGQENAPYVQEHTDLIASIRSGNLLNELKQVSESTLVAIMGRMTCYTGKELTWDQALNSQELLMPSPAEVKWGDRAIPPVAIPGKTAFI